MLKCLKSLLCLGALLMNWIMKPEAGQGNRPRGRWRRWTRGKTLAASRPGRTLEDAHTLQASTLDVWISERKAARLIGTRASSKASPWRWFSPLSVHDPPIQETNPLNQIGLSCKDWLRIPLSGSRLPAGVNGLFAAS